jgi:glycerol-3-phosphate responsive antiterminator
MLFGEVLLAVVAKCMKDTKVKAIVELSKKADCATIETMPGILREIADKLDESINEWESQGGV